MNGPSALQYHMLLSRLHTETGIQGQSRVQSRDTEDAPEMDWVWLQVCETFTLIVWDISLSTSLEVGLIFPFCKQQIIS